MPRAKLTNYKQQTEAHRPKPADPRPADGEEDEEVDEEEEGDDEENDPNKNQRKNPSTKKSPQFKKVASGDFDFEIQCQYGTLNSLKEAAIHDLSDWHEKSFQYPPTSVHSIAIGRQQFACSRYYDEQGNEFQKSVFHITAKSQIPGDQWPIRKYALLVLHEEGKTGEPIIFTKGVLLALAEGSRRLSLGYVWDNQEERFDADPFAIRIYIPEKMADAANGDNFDPSFFDISDRQHRSICQELNSRARGRPRVRETAAPFSSAVKSEFPQVEMRRPEKRLKTEGGSFIRNDESTRLPGAMPQLLSSARVRLLSEESDHARVFSLDGCDIKSLFSKAREFFGVKDPEKEISLVCRAPGLGSRRFIGEDCDDEFSLLCHDVRKLFIAERGSVEITIKPAAPERIQKSG